MKKTILILSILHSIFVLAQTDSQQLKVEGDFSKEKDTVLVRLKSNCIKAKNDSIKCQALLSLSFYQKSRNIDNAKEALDEAFKIYQSRKYNFSLVTGGRIYEAYGSIYRRLGDYEKSLKLFHKAKNSYMKLSDVIYLSRVNHSISVLYNSIGDEHKSEQYVKEAIQINEKINYKEGLAFNYSHIGSIYRRKKKRDSAMYYYERAKQYFLEVNIKSGWYRVNGHIAKILTSDGKYEKALKLHFENLDNKVKLGYNQGIISTCWHISSVYAKLKDYKKAEEFADKALGVAKKEGLLKMISNSYLHKANIYKTFKKYQKAFINTEKYYKYRDSIVNIDNVKKIQKLELTYQFKKEKEKDSIRSAKEKEIVETRATLLEQESKIKTQWMLFGGISLLALMVIIYMRYREKNKRNILENQLLNSEIEYKKKDLKRFALNIASTKEWALSLVEKIQSIDTDDFENNKEKVKELENDIKNKIRLDESTEAFYNKVELLSSSFYENLKNTFPDLTKTEVRLCALMRLDMNTKQIATLQNITPLSVKRSRNRLRKKLNLNPEGDLNAFLSKF